MLGSADLGVVERERGVTALRTLLDAEALAALLSERRGTAHEVTPGRLRYKPGTSCVLAFDLRTITDEGPVVMPCIAKAYAPSTTAKWEKSLQEVPRGHLLLEDPGLRLVITTLAGDRHLRAVSRLFDDAARLPLLERLLPGHTDLAAGTVTTLRHNPERRWVGTLDTPAGDRLVLRAYPRSSALEHIHAYARLHGTGADIPAFLGKTRRHGMLAVSWADGDVLGHSADPADLRVVGRALAGFHLRRPPELGVSTPLAHADRVRRAAAQVALLQPDAAEPARQIADHLISRLREAPVGGNLVHGDFSRDQVVLGPGGEPSLIDLDSAAVGEAATDLGSFWAALLVEARSPAEEAGITGRVETLMSGYDTLRRPPDRALVLLYRDSHLLGRAAEGFRTRRPRWAEHMSRVLSTLESGAARTALADGGPR